MKAKQLAAFAIAALAVVGAASAACPNNTVRLVVPFAPGDSPDLSARVFADALGRKLGSNVIVENRAGASGAIAAQEVLKAAGDGCTLLYATTAMMTITPLLRKVPYDPDGDFAPVAKIAGASMIVAVNAGFPADNWQEFVAELRRNPGKYAFASSGDGTILHLAGMHLQSVTGTKMLHVPYKGLAPAIADLLSGQVNLTLELTTALPQIQAGKLKAFAVLDDRPVPELPNVPTAKALNIPYNLKPWFAVFAPKATPTDVVARIAEASRRASEDPTYKAKLPVGTYSTYENAAVLAKSVSGDRQEYRTIISQIGLKLE